MAHRNDPTIMPYCEQVRALYYGEYLSLEQALFLLEVLHSWGDWEVNQIANKAFLEGEL